MTDDAKTLLERLIQQIKQQRDELRLQVHLGSQELKQEWEKLDERLAELNQRYQPLKDAVEESTDDVWDAMQLVGSEILDGFSRIRKSL